MTDNTVRAFDRNAALYAEKYFGLSDYDRFYAQLLPFLPPNGSFIDIACGPGNASAYVATRRPDVQILGLDLAPGMVEQARARVPCACFIVADCCNLEKVPGRFDAAAFCFGLSYLSDDNAAKVLAGVHARLKPGAALLVSTITGESFEERLETCSTGEKMSMVYRTVDQVLALLEAHALTVIGREIVDSPSTAVKATRDLVVLSQRRCV